MSLRPLVLDVSRLLWRAIRKAPGGIDRLELAMAQHLLQEEPTARFVFTDGGRLRMVRPAAVRRLIQSAATRWEGGTDDAGCRRVAAYLGGDDQAFPLARVRLTDRHVPLVDLARSSAAGVLYHRGAFERDAAQALNGAAYMNLSHRNLGSPGLLASLSRFSQALCYLHDDIPLREPGFAASQSSASFRQFMQRLPLHALRIVTNSETSRDRLMESAAGFGQRMSPIEVVAPPVAPLFSDPSAPPACNRNFFLMPGLITARKNIRLILQACCQMDRVGLGFDVVLAGAPGLDAPSILTELDQAPAGVRFLRAEGLSDHAMALLSRGARAVLAPSVDEGFDYPVHEALAGSVPVLASDIPAHREYVEGFAELLDPRDATHWALALQDFAQADSPRRLAALEAARRFSPPAPQSLMRRLLELAREPGFADARHIMPASPR